MKSNRTASDVIMTDADWRVLDSLKVRNLQHLRGLNADLEKDIIREISDGINAGEGMPDLSARITEATNIAKTRADTIARTETINACIDGARQRYQQLGIEEVEVIACDDSRTCPICTTHDGKIYKLSDDANLPPYHPNCRCAIKAVVKKRDKKEELEKLKRRAENEKIPEKYIPLKQDTQQIPYIPATTTKEAEKWARDAGIPRPDYSGVDLYIANTMNQRHAEMVRLAPKTKESVTAIGSAKSNRAYLMSIRAAQVEAEFQEGKATGNTRGMSDKGFKKYLTNIHPLTKNIKETSPSELHGTFAYFSPVLKSGADARGVYVNMEYINWLKKNGSSLEKELKKLVEDKDSPQGCDTVKYLFDHEYGHAIDSSYDLSKDSEILKFFNEWRSLSEKDQIESLCRYAAECKDTLHGKPSEFIAECWGEFLNNPTPRETSIKVGKRILDIVTSEVGL